MKKTLLLLLPCLFFGVSCAAEITSDFLFLLASQIIESGRMSENEIVTVFKSCSNNNKKLWKQCGEVVKMFEDKKENTFVLKEVIDGDTIKVEENGVTYNVRMIGIDSPESLTTRYGYVEEFGKEASDYLKKLITGKEITLEFDETQGEEDKYGRKLAYVFSNGININKKMIEDGYAREYTYNLPYKYQTEFKQAQKEAELKNNGLRGITGGERLRDREEKITNTNYGTCGNHVWNLGPRGGCYYLEGNEKIYGDHYCCY